MPAPKLPPGKKDGRVRSGRKPSESPKDELFRARLKPDDKAWLMDNGGTAWLEAKIREARALEAQDSPTV